MSSFEDSSLFLGSDSDKSVKDEKNDRSNTCAICLKTFANRSNLHRHDLAIHKQQVILLNKMQDRILLIRKEQNKVERSTLSYDVQRHIDYTEWCEDALKQIYAYQKMNPEMRLTNLLNNDDALYNQM